jgi:hypothetical protein
VLELEILPDYAGGTQGGLVHLVSLSRMEGGADMVAVPGGASGFAGARRQRQGS